MLNRHGENRRVWPQSRIAAPLVLPASSTSGVRPRSRRWAAVVSPTGPAPMTTTGRLLVWLVVSAMAGLLKDGGGCRFGGGEEAFGV